MTNAFSKLLSEEIARINATPVGTIERDANGKTRYVPAAATNATWTNSRGETIRVWAEAGYAWPSKADMDADRPVVAMYSISGACTGPSGGRVVRDSATCEGGCSLWDCARESGHAGVCQP